MWQTYEVPSASRFRNLNRRGGIPSEAAYCAETVERLPSATAFY
jgi:hypothetical protein